MAIRQTNISLNKSIRNILLLLEQKLPDFKNSHILKNRFHKDIQENDLTSALRFFLEAQSDSLGFSFSFETQPPQPNSRTVDLGFQLKGEAVVQYPDEIGNYIFFIEAKWLSANDYVTTNTGAIKRFKCLNHGVVNPNPTKQRKYVEESAIVGYADIHFDNAIKNINRRIQKLSKDFSIKTDEFGLNWQNSEQLTPEQNKTGRYNSEHTRIDQKKVKLHHFWVYLTPKLV